MGSSGETLCILDSLVIVLDARAKGDAGGGEVRSTEASEKTRPRLKNTSQGTGRRATHTC